MAQSKKTNRKPKKIPDLSQIQEEIRQRAHIICLERGDGEGDALSDWLKAEKEIKGKYKLS